MLSVALVIVVLVFSFVCRVVSINGPSMTPTLLDGDRVVVTNFMYTPEVGDVIVVAVSARANHISSALSARGRTVDFDHKKQLLVDGQLIEEPYINEQMQDFTGTAARFPYRVPEDRILYGDNAITQWTAALSRSVQSIAATSSARPCSASSHSVPSVW